MEPANGLRKTGPAGAGKLPVWLRSLSWLFLIQLYACQAQQPSPEMAPKTGVPAEVLLEQVLEVTGWNSQLRKMPQKLQEKLSKNPALAKLPPNIGKAVIKVFKEVFQPENFRNVVVRRFRSKLDAGRLVKVRDAYQTPLLQRLVGINEEFEKPEFQGEFLSYMVGLAEHPAPPARRRISRRIANALNVEVVLSRMLLEMSTMMVRIFAIADPKLKNYIAELTEEVKRELKSKHFPLIRKISMVTYLYAFREMKLGEMERLAEILEREEMRWYHDLMSQVTIDTIIEGMEQSLDKLGKIKT